MMNPQYPSNIQYGMGPSTGQPGSNTSASTLYVGNLDKDLDRQTVEAFFITQQNVEPATKVDIKMDMAGDSRGFAFVTYSSQKAAANAKTILNHSRIRNNEIAIAFLKPPQDQNPDANLFISNLDRRVTSKELEELCAPYGSIVSCKVRYSQDSTPQYSLGYGYVQFEQPSSANECREGLSGKLVHEKPVKVEKFTPRGKRNTTNQQSNLYIKDFPEKFNQKQVEDFINTQFQAHGKVASKGVFPDPKMNKFYAFVAFESADNAKKALEALNGHTFPGETQTKLYVDYAQSREQRKQQLANKFQATTNDTNVFIKSLKGAVTEAGLREVFAKFGPITSVCVKAHELNGKSEATDKKVMKFGFINFADALDAKKAMTEGKKDDDVKALIDEGHFKNQEFLYFAQPKQVRNKYLKMQRVNQRPAQQYQKMMKMYENFVAMMTQQMYKGGNPNYKQGQNFKTGPKQHYNRRGQDQPQGNQMGNYMNTMMQQMMMMQMPNMQGGGAYPQALPGQMPGQMYPGVPQNYPMNVNPMVSPCLTQMFQHPMMMQNPGMGQQFAQPQVQVPVQAQPNANAKNLAWLKANLKEFEAYPQTEKKNLLGNMMYNRVLELKPPTELIPKITGMLIDLEVLTIQEIIEILENREILEERTAEARAIIEGDEN